MTRSRRLRAAARARAFTLVELLAVVGIMGLLLAILLPSLKRAREAALKVRLASEAQYAAQPQTTPPTPEEPVTSTTRPGQPARALVHSFHATIGLTPQLSVGTAEPESIYAAAFRATLDARRGAEDDNQSEVELPLPPQVISLGDLAVSIDGEPSDAVHIRGDKLVWRGPLPAAATARMDIAYTAVGKGLYTLRAPPGGILER